MPSHRQGCDGTGRRLHKGRMTQHPGRHQVLQEDNAHVLWKDRAASSQPSWVAAITSCLLQPAHNSSIEPCTGGTVIGSSLEQHGAAAAQFQHTPSSSTTRTLNSNYVPASVSFPGQNEPKSIFVFFQLSSTRQKFGQKSIYTDKSTAAATRRKCLIFITSFIKLHRLIQH